MIYIVDIDGTVADLTHRLYFIQGEHKDWDAFYRACGGDTPIPEVIAVLKAIAAAGPMLVFATGRSEAVMGSTFNWLSENVLVPTALYMRKEEDHRLGKNAVKETVQSVALLASTKL